MIEEAELLKAEVINQWEEYERRKKELSHDLTEVEFERACKRIADELGL